jgi:kumamolisin
MKKAILILTALASLVIASPSTDRITFNQSIKEVATTQPQFAFGTSGTLVRSELTPSEAQATLDFSVALKMHNFAELQERLGSAEIISFDEMAAKYYPTATEYKTVVDWLTAQGFTVKPPNKYNLSVFASGPLAQIQRAFGTKFGRIKFVGVEYTSALTAPSLPAAVAAPVLGINGLQPHLHPITHFIKAAPSQGMQKLINNQPPYTVGEIAKAYGANGLNVNGVGQKIGIVIDTFPADSDLTLFWNANAIPQSLNNIEKVQVVPGTLPSPTGEETLDVEWSSGSAPGAKVRVYATTALAFVYLDQAYQAILNDLPSQPGLHQISLSYGLGETYMSPSQMQTDDQYFVALAGAGVTVFVSSGDGGSSPGTGGHDHTGPVQVESPANDPNVTAVGGTSLYLNTSTGAVSSETAWYDGGGGISTIFTRPTWQIGPGVAAGSTRLVPDVALVADPNTGGILFLGGAEYLVGGTSWSAPTWAGISAKINQARVNLGMAPIGLLGPKIYPLIGTSNFRDITSGTNGPNGFYNAGPGYDLCTGIGVPSVDALIQALAVAHYRRWRLQR